MNPLQEGKEKRGGRRPSPGIPKPDIAPPPQKSGREESRSCYSCCHRRLCFLYRRIEDATMGIGMLNINTDDAPGQWSGIFVALGRACMEYQAPA